MGTWQTNVCTWQVSIKALIDAGALKDTARLGRVGGNMDGGKTVSVIYDCQECLDT